MSKQGNTGSSILESQSQVYAKAEEEKNALKENGYLLICIYTGAKVPRELHGEANSDRKIWEQGAQKSLKLIDCKEWLG